MLTDGATVRGWAGLGDDLFTCTLVRGKQSIRWRRSRPAAGLSSCVFSYPVAASLIFILLCLIYFNVAYVNCTATYERFC